VRAHRPGPRQIELAAGEDEYLREHWGLIAAVTDALRTERNVRLAVLFGSLARGDADENSDVDLLVWFAEERPLCKAQLAARLARTLRRDVMCSRSTMSGCESRCCSRRSCGRVAP